MTTTHRTTDITTVARFTSHGLPVRIDRRTVETHTDGGHVVVRRHYRAEVACEDWRLSVDGDATVAEATSAAVRVAEHVGAEIALAEEAQAAAG